MEEKHIHFKQETVYGDKYDIHDNPYATFNFGGRRESRGHGEYAEAEPAEDSDDYDSLLDGLKSIFYGDAEEARLFAGKVRHMSSKETTAHVNILIKQNKISKKSCLKPLWELLTRHGLYDKSYQNWFGQIKT